MTALLLDGVGKRFGGVVAVSDVSMEIAGGRITGLIGPNGAGKTTVVNLITGMLNLTTGSITLAGRDISTARPETIARTGISRTFQNIRLLREASVLENVVVGFHRHERASLLSAALGLRLARRETREVFDRGRLLLEQFGMARYSDHPAGDLAYGHQRRVEIMRAVATSPTILLLDEPVAGMNEVEAAELGEIFQRLAAQGMGLLLIEHNVRFVMRLCQFVYVLDAGRTIAAGAPSEVMRDERVLSAYLGAA